jgi:peptidylprolyl isomerase
MPGAVIASMAIVALACGGSGPSSERGLGEVIVLTPTPAEATCLNAAYPADAPEFGDDGTIDYESLDSGVGVFDHEEGVGASVESDSNVRVRYTGFLDDGCVFDSTYTRDTVSSFQLTNLIEGWQIGMAEMREGGKRRMRIPPGLAYGVAGYNRAGFVIPGNATLIFEVDLVEVVQPEQDTPPG